MPLFQRQGQPNTPTLYRRLGDLPDKLASKEGICNGFEVDRPVFN